EPTELQAAVDDEEGVAGARRHRRARRQHDAESAQRADPRARRHRRRGRLTAVAAEPDLRRLVDRRGNKPEEGARAHAARRRDTAPVVASAAPRPSAAGTRVRPPSTTSATARTARLGMAGRWRAPVVRWRSPPPPRRKSMI